MSSLLEAGGTEIRGDAGTIGAELLMRFKWVLDFNNNTAYLKANKYFGQEQALDRSGIWLIEVENGEKMVYKIISDSPCAATSMQEGQVIESIDGQIATEMSLFEITQLLKQRDGIQIRIKVKGNDESMVIILRTMI
jgi:C-terminal processing protease CtpA/Prc